MKKHLLKLSKTILIFCAFISFGKVSAQTQIIWTDTFTTGIAATPTQTAAWLAFCTSLTPRTYTKVTIKGTFDLVGQSCNDTSVPTALANALNTNIDYISPSACSGNVWHNCASHGYHGEVWLNPPSSCNGSNCPNGYIIRPDIGNYNWGGVNTATCSAPNQRMTLIFEYITPTSSPEIKTPLADLDVFPNPFSNSFNVSVNNITTAELSVTDLLGRVVYTRQISAGTTTIDTDKFVSGIYFVSVKTAGGVTSKKIIKG